MGLSADIRRQLIESFKAEQGEHIQKINEGLLALEKNPEVATASPCRGNDQRQALLDEIFREAHSLKGAARAVGMTIIESLGHALEDLLLGAKEGRLTFSPDLFDLLYETLDAVQLVMDQLEAGKSTPSAQVLALLARLEQAREAVPNVGQVANLPVAKDHLDQHPQAGENQAAEEPAGQAAEEPDFSPNPQSPISNPQSPQSPPPDPQPPTPGPHSDETIRVSVNKLDALMAQFSELLGAKIRAEQRLAEVRELQGFAAEWHKEWLALRSHYSRLIRNGQNSAPDRPAQSANRGNGHSPGKDVASLINFTTYNQEQLRAFSTQANMLYRQLSNDTMRMSLMIDELQAEIKRVRMLPLSTITATFGRMVRDLAREQGKEITLTIAGGETELDKRVLEQIKDPLIHLLRNAADHGIEASADREAAGKPADGHIVLSASQQGNNVVITVSDDGAGLDLQAIRMAAVRKGLLSGLEAEKLTETDTANLIFNSGLSTSSIITDISGRGVGLDVVRQNVEELHGTLDVNFEPGRGTIFTMTLPLTLASSRGLLVRVGQQIFALPHSTVERMLHLKRSDIASVEGKEAITYQGKPVALAWLADLLALPQTAQTCTRMGACTRTGDGHNLTIVIVTVAEKRLGLIVDDLVGEQEIVMKSLGKQLAKVGGLAGATVLGSGQVILVLHTADLVKLATRTRSRPPVTTDTNHQETAQRKTILVVDDSITTRTLEKNILEAAGYEVKLATDGEEALGILVSDGLPNLIISDINMPRLDGFGLTGRLKQDDRYADVPVILVTSLDSPADKARGIEVGADAYIVKSSFDQGNLLETIEQLV